MQNTNFSKIIRKSNNFLFDFLISTWKSKSISSCSVLMGYFLFANFLTKFISEGKNELVMVPLIMIFAELIIRFKPSPKFKAFNFWVVIDKVRIGATYAIILEAFKLGS